MIAVGDFDHNGSPDLVTVGRLDKYASVLLSGAASAPGCAAYEKPKLTLGKILAPPGDDTLAFAGAFAAPVAPPDPDLSGLSITLAGGGGLNLSVAIPAGSYNKVTKTDGRSTRSARNGRGSIPPTVRSADW